MLSTTPPTGRANTHSDLAFSGNLAIAGNYNGFEIFDIANPSKPVLMQTYLCPASQNDVSVYRNRRSCRLKRLTAAPTAASGVPEPVRTARGRHLRVRHLDIKRPKLVTTVDVADRTRTRSCSSWATTPTCSSMCQYGRRPLWLTKCPLHGRRRRSEHRAVLPEVIKVLMKAPCRSSSLTDLPGPVPSEKEERDA
jgi:hypothetical protein